MAGVVVVVVMLLLLLLMMMMMMMTTTTMTKIMKLKGAVPDFVIISSQNRQKQARLRDQGAQVVNYVEHVEALTTCIMSYPTTSFIKCHILKPQN